MDSVRRLDDNFLAELSDILAWAAHQGIMRHTRFHIYKENITWLRAHDGEEDRSRVHSQLSSEGRLTEIQSTMTESIELVETISSLRRHDVVIPKELLQRVFSGPVDAFLEDHSSNEARNAMFELSMCAMAARHGLKPKISTGNPDVSFEFEDRFVKMECKRVLSENRVMGRLKEGIRQLEKSVRSATSDVGVVAISLSKIINRGDRFLVSDSPHEDLSQGLHNALKANEQRLATMRRPSVTGFLFYVSSAAYVPGLGYSPINSGTVFPLNLAEQGFLSRLADALAV